MFFFNHIYALLAIAMGGLFFSGAGTAQEMCSLPGPTGPCQIMANAVALSNAGCRAWANSDYQGVCLNGKLEGVGLLRNPHPDGKKVSFYLANFRAGIPDDPIVSFHSDAIAVNYVQQAKQFDVCVWFDESGKKSDDIRGKSRICNSAEKIFGSDILSDATYQRIRTGQFNVRSPVLSADAPGDAPKTVGRGARSP